MTTNKQLRELAEKATPGPWGWDGPVWGYDAENEAPWLIQERGSDVVITGEIQCSEANAEYIATASPEVITALLDENEALQAECALRKNSASGAHQQLITNQIETEKLAVDWSKAVAECEKLRKDAERYRWLKPHLYVMDTYSGKGISYEVGIDGAEVPDIDDVTEAIDAAIQEDDQ